MDIDKLFNITDADRELYNIYSRMSATELLKLNCVDKVCKVVKFERLNDKGDASKFAAMTIGGLLPILSSFPTFDEGLAFIESFKPGFRYSKYFKQFAESHIKVELTEDRATVYKLGDYEYVVLKKDDIIRGELYRYKGKRHRIDGPAYVEYYKNKTPELVEYWINGQRHNEIGPAFIFYNYRGDKGEESYYVNDKKINNKGGPTKIIYNQYGRRLYEYYHNEDGELSRVDGPAIINYLDNGIIYKEEYLIKNKLHRTDGPAIITYNNNGDIIVEEYWIDNVKQS